jgi:hypothetical protein
MKTAKNQPALGFQSLEDLRPVVLALGELREAAALGLGLPPPSDTPQRRAAPQGRPEGGPMNAATMLEHLLPRWQAALPAEYAPEYIEGFIRRNRRDLEAFIAHAMTLRRAKRGLAPRSPEEFAAYGQLAARELKRDPAVEAEVIARVAKWLDRRLERAEGDEARAEVMAMAAAFAAIFAETVLLESAGRQAVPLLLRRPALAILERSELIAVRDAAGELHIAPTFKGDPQVLRAQVMATQTQVRQLREGIADATRFDRHAHALWARTRALAHPPAAPRELELPPDHQTRAWRTEANLQAMRLVLAKEPGELTTEDLRILAQYSGWGGLSIERVQKLLPPELVPEPFGLVHEYYTPPPITESLAELLCPLLPELAGNDGVVRALEPSAGIGRLIRSFSPRRCLALEAGGQIKKIAWTAVEFSKVSSTLLRALRPDVDLYHMPFERWIREQGSRFQGTISLIVANPPYGERGEMAREDPDEFYKEKRAYAYFMRRALDLLVPGGIGVFLVPAGFLEQHLNREPAREAAAPPPPARRLSPAEPRPARPRDRPRRLGRHGPGDLAQPRRRAQRGRRRRRVHRRRRLLQGVPRPHPRQGGRLFAGDDEAGTARLALQGDRRLQGFPPLTPRPVCTACVLGRSPRAGRRLPDRHPRGRQRQRRRRRRASPRARARPARRSLPRGTLGADEADKAAQLWPELHAALVDFAASFGNPWRSKPLRELAEGPSARRPADPRRLREDRRADRGGCVREDPASSRSSPASPTTSSPRPRRSSASSAR